MSLRHIFLLFLLLPAFCQGNAQKAPKKITLSGYVTDSDGKAVEGAVVFIDNVKTEYLTDAKGFYKLRIKPGAGLLTIFSLRCGMKEVKIEGQDVINVRLEGSSAGSAASPVAKPGNSQVNIGYGSVDSKELTSSVGKINGQNSKFASYTSIYDMIRGEVPGVQVIGKSITIQGISSINSSTAPLLVVDGMVVESIDDLRPQNVKSIEILKGASASIYGSRGTNGVILITMQGAEKRR